MLYHFDLRSVARAGCENQEPAVKMPVAKIIFVVVYTLISSQS